VRCKQSYGDSDAKVLTGCDCGSRLFFFVKGGQDIKAVDAIIRRLTPKKIDAFESSISQMDDERRKKVDEIIEKAASSEPEPAAPVAPKAKAGKPAKEKKARELFGIETVKSTRPGVYEINIKGLLDGQPVIVLSKGGSYIIHLPSVFEGSRKA